MDIFDAYGMSDEAMEKGIWAELVVGTTSIGKVRVRSLDPDINAEYRKGLATSGLAKAVSDGADPDKLAVALIADTIVTDWELYTMKGDKEVKLPYSRKKCVELLTKLPKFRSAVERAASNWTRYRASEFQEAVKT